MIKPNRKATVLFLSIFSLDNKIVKVCIYESKPVMFMQPYNLQKQFSLQDRKGLLLSFFRCNFNLE